MPWGPEVYYQVPLSSSKMVGLAGYLAWWNLISLTQPERCAELLAHLGFDYLSQHLPYKQQPLLLCKDKKSDLAKRQTSKTVYSCLVVGPRDAGKTTLCQRFLGRSLEESLAISAEDKPSSLVNSVLVYGQQKYLVMLDADVLAAADGLDSTQTNCDVVCLVYDSSNPRSFEYCARIYLVRPEESPLPSDFQQLPIAALFLHDSSAGVGGGQQERPRCGEAGLHPPA